MSFESYEILKRTNHDPSSQERKFKTSKRIARSDESIDRSIKTQF